MKKDNIKNFGFIKSIYNNLLTESLINGDIDNKKKFGQYVKIINEDEILKTQFSIFTNIENKVETDPIKASLFLNENINLLSRFKKEDIINSNKKLFDIVKDKELFGEHVELYEDITTLIFEERTPNTIDRIVEKTSKIVNFIINNKVKEKIVTESVCLPNSMLVSIMVDKYNKKYAELNESEKNFLKTLINSDENAKKDVYVKLIDECNSLINEKLLTEDLNLKTKLLMVKEKLLSYKENIGDDFTKNLNNLLELRNNLT